MRRILIFAVFVFLPCYMHAQTEESIRAVLQVIGVSEIEEADEEEVERLHDILRHPLRINYADRQKMESTGLFTSYQIASVEDYRSRHGDILSLTELSAIDGFTSRLVQKLSPFISFESCGFPSHTGRTHVDIQTRGQVKAVEASDHLWNYSLRGRISFKDRCKLAVSAGNTSLTGSLSWNHKYGKILIGTYNARFAQGLCLWNTMRFSYLSGPSAFMLRPSGISQPYSFTGSNSLIGVAGDFVLDRLKISYMLSQPQRDQLDPALNISGYFSSGHIGLTHKMSFSDVYSKDYMIPGMKTSADFSLCFRGNNIFGEIMYDWISRLPHLIYGVEIPTGTKVNIASLIRYLPSDDEHGFALACETLSERHQTVFSADALCRPSGGDSEGENDMQLKGQIKWRWNFAEDIYAEIRMTERYRTWGVPFRTDIRLDLHYQGSSWSLASRFNFLYSTATGMLGYLEASYSLRSTFRLYIRPGIFMVDNWSDRIYVYERDAPGSFNVPAFYGRGVWASAYLIWNFSSWGRVYLRSSYISYLMMNNEKPGKTELKIQFALHF